MASQTYSQDTLIEPTSHKGVIGIFADSASAKRIALRLEEGVYCEQELKIADSQIQTQDSIITSLNAVNNNLREDILLIEGKLSVESEKSGIWKEKYHICDKERRRARRQRFVWGIVGVIGGTVTGIVVSSISK